MEDLEKNKLAEKIKSTSLHVHNLIVNARFFDIDLSHIASCTYLKDSPCERSASFYFDTIKTLMGIIEEDFSDIRNFINENS